MVYRTISVGGDTGPYGVRLSDIGRENIGASDMVLENVCRGAHRAPVLPWSAGVDRAGAQCAPPTTGLPTFPESTAAFAAPGQRFDLQAPEASRGEGGRAAADAYSMAEDGGALSGYRLLCESHRRRVRSAMVGRRTGLPKVRRVLGFLGGSESGLCLPAGG